MSFGTRSRAAEILRAAAPLAFIGAIATVLLFFPPTRYSFYPQCPVYGYLHLQCPGCGTTRALAALLRGHIVEALRLNALTTILMPPATIYATLCYRRYLQRKPLHLPHPPNVAIYSALAVALIFAVVRNLGLL